MQIERHIKEIHYFQSSFNGDFESTMNSELRKVNNVFQEQLKSDIEQIENNTKSLFLQINLETLICYNKKNIQSY